MNESEEDLILVRDILAREIETINTYERLLSKAQTEEVKTFLKHITEEEKEHVAEALELIKRFDPSQAALLGEGNHWGQTPAAPARPASFQGARSLTVGSLRKSGE
jgi:hypothetical protein